MGPFLLSLIILCLMPVCAGVCLRACVADMLEGKGLILHMVLATYSILPAVSKWRPANGAVYTFAKMCVKSIFFRFHLIKQVTPTITLPDAMRPEDDSCMDKVKEMYPRSNSST